MRFLVPLTLLVVIGCGSAVADHDAFRRIQRAEASTEDGVHVATDEARECAERCGGQTKACDSSETVCDIADDTGDKDALARCERTQRQCQSAALRTRSSCDC